MRKQYSSNFVILSSGPLDDAALHQVRLGLSAPARRVIIMGPPGFELQSSSKLTQDILNNHNLVSMAWNEQDADAALEELEGHFLNALPH